MLEKLAVSSYTHRRRVIIGWVLAAIVLTTLGSTLSRPYASGARLPGTDSDRANQLLAKEFPAVDSDSATVVFEARQGLDRPTTRAAVSSYLDSVRGLAYVGAVSSPFDDRSQLSADRTIAYATVQLAAGTETRDFQESALQLEKRAGPLQRAGVRTEFSGEWFSTGSLPPTEAIGLLAATVILVLTFGSLVAMGLPIVTSLIGVVVGLAGVGLWTSVVPTPSFTPQVATMIGIGVGIDYALFIITRYRTELARGEPLDALRTTMATAGRAVVLAGLTVVISLLGMMLAGLRFLQGLAFGTSTAVLVAVLAALTLLPALLSLTTGRLQRSADRHVRRASGHEGLWHRWGRLVSRWPWPVALSALALLLALCAPLAAIRLASTDDGNDPKGSTTRAAYQLKARGFGPGSNGPLVVAVESAGADARVLGALRSRVADTPGVAAVSPVEVSHSGRAARFIVIPTTSPQSRATETLVHRLRDDVLPSSGQAAHIGGNTANDVDFSQLMATRLPLFIGAVLALSFLLLAIVFRSILVPIKAVLLNLLSIGAAYGVMVAVFQWGWFANVLGVTPGPIEAWVPMLLFAIVFGLSMDYEVFLLSAVREHFDRTGDNRQAVVEGLASTARVITAAAAIMIFVFGGFVFGDDRSVKLIGLGLAVAVFIDASVVRMVLVPATMELLGDRNWWIPRWMDRLLPRVSLERTVPPEPVIDARAIELPPRERVDA